MAVLIAVLIWVVLNKTVFGYELRATGLNKEAAKYSGMKEKTNTILTLAIGGALAGLGASFLFLSGFEQWSVTQSSVPTMGFNGIAATFLGGLHPIGTIFSSYFIQHITSGGSYLDKAVFPAQISDDLRDHHLSLRLRCVLQVFHQYPDRQAPQGHCEQQRRSDQYSCSRRQ